MAEIIKFDEPYWRSFRLLDGKQRWFYTDEQNKISIMDKEWFNKNTIGICIHKGYETKENDTEPISDMIYRIAIDYKIANYFGDKSGRHYRSKIYMLIGDKLFKQENGEAVEVNRMTKELKGALAELEAR